MLSFLVLHSVDLYKQKQQCINPYRKLYCRNWGQVAHTYTFFLNDTDPYMASPILFLYESVRTASVSHCK